MLRASRNWREIQMSPPQFSLSLTCNSKVGSERYGKLGQADARIVFSSALKAQIDCLPLSLSLSIYFHRLAPVASACFANSRAQRSSPILFGSKSVIDCRLRERVQIKLGEKERERQRERERERERERKREREREREREGGRERESRKRAVRAIYRGNVGVWDR